MIHNSNTHLYNVWENNIILSMCNTVLSICIIEHRFPKHNKARESIHDILWKCIGMIMKCCNLMVVHLVVGGRHCFNIWIIPLCASFHVCGLCPVLPAISQMVSSSLKPGKTCP